MLAGLGEFMEKFYPDLIPHASTCKSPMSMLSTLIKTYYADGSSAIRGRSTRLRSCPASPRSTRPVGPNTSRRRLPLHGAVLTTREPDLDDPSATGLISPAA